jgi:hypothetical protein
MSLRRSRWPAIVVGVITLAACGGDEPAEDRGGPDGVSVLLAGPSADDVVVEGSLFADPGSVDRGSSIRLCDSVGPADVPDVPYYECRGQSVELSSDIDLYLLELGWSGADGQHEYSAPVSLTGDFDGGDLEVTEVRRRDVPVTDIRSDVSTLFPVPRGEVDLCDRLSGTIFGLPAPNDTSVDQDGTVMANIVWGFDDVYVAWFDGDVEPEGTWSCFGNRVRWFGTSFEARLVEADGLLGLVTPSGSEYVEYR